MSCPPPAKPERGVRPQSTGTKLDRLRRVKAERELAGQRRWTRSTGPDHAASRDRTASGFETDCVRFDRVEYRAAYHRREPEERPRRPGLSRGAATPGRAPEHAGAGQERNG